MPNNNDDVRQNDTFAKYRVAPREIDFDRRER